MVDIGVFVQQFFDICSQRKENFIIKCVDRFCQNCYEYRAITEELNVFANRILLKFGRFHTLWEVFLSFL